MWETAAEWHAALNDLPPALFVASVVFDLTGSVTRRDALKTAAHWTLVGAAIGAVAALVSGLVAEGTIEHGAAVHEVMERHEALAKVATAALVGLAGWRVWRRGLPGRREHAVYLTAAVATLAGVVFVAHLGGTVVFRHGGGIPTSVLEAAIAERESGHEHAEGEEHDHDPAGAEVDAARPDTQPSSGDSAHTHAPGTPTHRH